MSQGPAGTEEPVYASLIGEHFRRRLDIFKGEQLEQVLERCGLERDGDGVRAKGGAALDSETAYRYKQALKAVFGAGVYSMTKVNFTLAGCRCRDCQDR